MMSAHTRRPISAKTFVGLVIVAVQLLPVYVTLTVALKGQTDLSSVWVLPAAPVWDNFAQALGAGKLARAFMNTTIITVAATALVVLLGALAGYPLARSRSRLNSVVLGFILAIMMIPALSLLVPLYVLMNRLRAISTFQGIIPVHVAFNLPLTVFLFTNFIRSVPRELDEAAFLDGCSVYSIFYRIMLPLLKPVTVTSVILTSVAVWNDFQYSIYFLQKSEMRVITLAINGFFGISGSNLHVGSAAALLSIIPVTVLFLVLQRYFVSGMVAGAIK
ncbi:MAG TPA: carbohydrate ABC transporter permease [Spirochaetia bacterium]|nr:carbohydrate ABC transporter permease [Spirochaetia bacterium]